VSFRSAYTASNILIQSLAATVGILSVVILGIFFCRGAFYGIEGEAL
jgi:hypothetical protein